MNFKKVTKYAPIFVAVGAMVFGADAYAAAEQTVVVNADDVKVLGMTAAAGTVFGVKAAPSMVMWAYRKMLGFLR